MARLQERIATEDEDQTTWTVAKFLASKGIAKVVAAALKLPPRVSGDPFTHFNYIKKDLGQDREKVVELLTDAKLEACRLHPECHPTCQPTCHPAYHPPCHPACVSHPPLQSLFPVAPF